MTKAMAYKILGITPGTDFTEIKKKYRQLMHRVHPDAEAFSTRAYDFTAQEINEAYDFLRKNRTDLIICPKKRGRNETWAGWIGSGGPCRWREAFPAW